jgi:hypothetical protein
MNLNRKTQLYLTNFKINIKYYNIKRQQLLIARENVKQIKLNDGNFSVRNEGVSFRSLVTCLQRTRLVSIVLALPVLQLSPDRSKKHNTLSTVITIVATKIIHFTSAIIHRCLYLQA